MSKTAFRQAMTEARKAAARTANLYDQGRLAQAELELTRMIANLQGDRVQVQAAIAERMQEARS